MKKYIKYLMGVIFFIGLYANSFGTSKTYATSTMLKDPDVLPPTGTISVEDAIYTGGVYHVSYRDIVLEVTANDNETLTDNLQMIVSGEKLTDDELKEDSGNWKLYSPKVDYHLNIENETNTTIYLYLKDEAGNISNSLMFLEPKTYTVTYEGEGTGIPESKTTKLRTCI